MAQPQQSAVRNRLLKALSPDDFALLQPHLEPIRHASFVEQGILSLMARMPRDRIEVGMIRREGMSNVAVFWRALGSGLSP